MLFPRLDLSPWGLVAILEEKKKQPQANSAHHSYAGKGCTSLRKANTTDSALFVCVCVCGQLTLSKVLYILANRN